LDELFAILEQNRRDLEARIKTLEEDKIANGQVVAALEEDNNELRESRRETIAALSDEKDGLRRQNTELTEKVSSLSGEVSRLTSEVMLIVEENEKLKSAVATQTAEVSLRTADSERRIAGLVEENERLQREKGDLFQRVCLRAADSESRILSVFEENKTLKIQNAGMAEQMTSLSAEVRRLTTESAFQIGELRSQLQSASDKRLEFVNQVALSSSEVDRLMEKETELQQQFQSVTRERAVLKDEVAPLRETN
jgi:chromosome segregation ATPase